MKKYLINILIGADQFLNCLWGGDPDETVSSRLGRIKLKNMGKIPWSRPWPKVVDWGLDLIDKNHSIDAIEEGEGKDGIFDRPGHTQNWERGSGTLRIKKRE